MFSNIQKFLQDKKGSIALIAAAGLPAVLAAAGGAIDFSRYNYVNSKFQAAADSALLAAASVAKTHEGDLNEVAEKFFKANFPEGYSDSLILNKINVVADPAKLQWTATADAQIKTYFGGFIGLDAIDVHHKVTVAWDVSKRVEAVFTLDTSASMCMDVNRSPRQDGSYMMEYKPDYTCKKLNAMKEAMSYVIENGLASIDGMEGPLVYAGIIPYNHKVRFQNPKNIPAPLTKSETTLARGDGTYFTDVSDAEPLSPIIPLRAVNSDSERAEMKNLIDGIVQSPTGKGWTRSNVSALTAALMLDPQYYSSFGGDRPSTFNPEKTDKVVVMMTDGANMGCCWAAHPEGNYDNQYLYLVLPKKGLCDQMKEAGITIYTILFDVDKTDPGGEAMHDVYKSCASNPQYFFDVKDNDDLKLAYQSVAQSLLKLEIVY